MWYLKTRSAERRRRVLRPLDPYCGRWRKRTFRSKKAMQRFMAKYPHNQYQEVFVDNAYGVLYKRLHRIDFN